MSESVPYYGMPRTAAEWSALTRIAEGNSNVSKGQLRRLFLLGLVERQLGRLCLTKHGREMLALYAKSPRRAVAGMPPGDKQLPLFRDSDT